MLGVYDEAYYWVAIVSSLFQSEVTKTDNYYDTWRRWAYVLFQRGREYFAGLSENYKGRRPFWPKYDRALSAHPRFCEIIKTGINKDHRARADYLFMFLGAQNATQRTRCSMNDLVWSAVRWDDTPSDKIALARGVRQGGVLCQILFAMYVGDLIES